MTLHDIFQIFAQSASQILWSCNPIQRVFLILPYFELIFFPDTSYRYLSSNFRATSDSQLHLRIFQASTSELSVLKSTSFKKL